MKTAVIDTLDKRKYLEDIIKNHIGYEIPKYILRNIALHIVVSSTAAQACIKIKNYLIQLYKEQLINNEEFSSRIYNFFSQSENIELYRERVQYMDHKKFVDEKKSLMGEKWNDSYEASKSQKKSLDEILKHGIKVIIHVDALRKVFTLAGETKPLIDALKNYRILQINNFAQSKVSHLTHDLFDHLYFFQELEQAGFFCMSAQFRKMVGNPHLRDIFSRESELVASIAYERRYYIQYEDQFRLSLKNEYIISLIENNFPDKTQQQVYKKKMDYLSKCNISVYHIYYNVLCELTEQIRKVGAIKLIDDLGQQKGNITSLLNDDYLKITIDILYFVTYNKVIFKDTLLKTYTYIEAMLFKALKSKNERYETIITLEKLQHYTPNKNFIMYIKPFFNL